MVQASTYNKALLLTCTAGIALCVYAFIVEEKKSQDPKYQAVCDIGERMSCSRVLTSKYAKGFGIVRHILGENSPLNVPNSIPGGIMYSLFALLSFINRSWSAKIQVGLGLLSVVVSIYLGAILYFALQDFCVVCVTTYAINFINLILAYLRLRALTSKPSGKQKGQQKSQKSQKKQQNDKQKSPQAAEKQKKQQSEKQKSPQADKQKNQQNGKVKNQQNDKQKSPKTPNSKKKN